LCTNLAVVAEAAGETCCIIDVDPQANALLWHERRGTNQPMVIDATYEKLPELIPAARTMGVTLVMIDTPGKIDAGALAAIKLADTIVCPTLGDLFSLGSIQDTVRLLEAAEKLGAAVSVINNVDETGKKQTLAEATAVLESFTLPLALVPIMHRRPFVSAVKRGKGVMETVPKGPATREIKALWEFLNKGATPKPKGRAAKMERAAR